jgi:hypothetical protein
MRKSEKQSSRTAGSETVIHTFWRITRLGSNSKGDEMKVMYSTELYLCQYVRLDLAARLLPTTPLR